MLKKEIFQIFYRNYKYSNTQKIRLIDIIIIFSRNSFDTSNFNIYIRKRLYFKNSLLIGLISCK